MKTAGGRECVKGNIGVGHMSIDKKRIGKILKVTAIGTGVTFWA